MRLRRYIAATLSALALTIALGAIPALGLAMPAHAACNPNELTINGGINCATPSSASQKPLFGDGGLFQKIANVLIYIIGAISVLMVIIGGLRYVLSAGNPSATSGAKDTILYAIIGVIVAALAFAIVNFVVGKFS